MTGTIFALNRKEMFSASMVIFIGLYYVILGAMSFVQTGFAPSSIGQLWANLKWLLSGILYVGGGVLMFRKKNAGWVISVATLLNLMIIVFANIVNLSQVLRFNAYIAIVIGFFLLLTISFLFLFGKPTRFKFTVNNKTYLLTIALYFLLLAVTFWL